MMKKGRDDRAERSSGTATTGILERSGVFDLGRRVLAAWNLGRRALAPA